MKKLLVLILLLGLSAMADAAIIQLSVNGSMNGPGNDVDVMASSAKITVVSDSDDFTYPYYLAIVTPGEDAGNYGTVTALPAAGASASVGNMFDGPEDGYVHITDIIALAYPPDRVLAGDQFWTTLTLTGSAVQIDLLDADAETVLDSVTLVVIPEPMTIALLGLGGLFLRRRK